MNANQNDVSQFYEMLFKDFPDVVKVSELKQMLPRTGKNKIYKLLQNKEIASKRIGRDYYIPKMNVIKYLIQK